MAFPLEPNEWVAFVLFHHVNRPLVFWESLSGTTSHPEVSGLSAVASVLNGEGDGAKWGAV